LEDADLLRDVQVYASLDAALADDPTVVVIANPTALHVTTALEAARHDCHVFIEKPLSDRLDGLDELCRVVRERGLVATVGYQLRFHPGFRQVEALLERGRIGTVCAVRAEVGQYLPDWHPWEDYRTGVSARHELGGGVVLDLSHEVDYTTALFGRARAVAAMIGRFSHLEIETEDTAEILLSCERAPVVSIHLDYVQRQPGRRCVVIGDRGTIVWDLVEQHVALLEAGGARETWQCDRDRNELFRDELRGFVDCIERRANPVVSLEAAVHVTAICVGAKRAARDGIQVLLEAS
jgi:predicted dehydrogenase